MRAWSSYRIRFAGSYGVLDCDCKYTKDTRPIGALCIRSTPPVAVKLLPQFPTREIWIAMLSFPEDFAV